MEEHRIMNYLLKFIIKIAFELCRVKQLAKQSEVSELYKKLKKHRNSNKKFLKIQLVYCIKYKQQSQSKSGIKKKQSILNKSNGLSISSWVISNWVKTRTF